MTDRTTGTSEPGRSDPAVAIFNGAAASDGFARVVSAVVCGALLLSCHIQYEFSSMRSDQSIYHSLFHLFLIRHSMYYLASTGNPGLPGGR